MITRKHVFTAAAAVALSVAVTGAAQAQSRDQIRAVGSSTVFPFSTAVAEAFGKGGKFKTPVVESTGTGGGLKLFCAGVGPAHPDIANASRRIEKSEVEQCAANGVTQITELKIGYDGIALAYSKKAQHVDLTTAIIWKALAKEVPVDGKLVANPYREVVGHRSQAAERGDRGARPAPDLGHARHLQRAGDARRLQKGAGSQGGGRR